MLKQNIRFALKMMKKNRTSFSIAILGLSLSLVASILLSSYCLFYWNFDKSVSNHNEWYRLRLSTYSSEGEIVNESGFYIQSAGIIIREIPQIKDYIIMQNNFLDINLNCEGKRIAINDKCSVTKNLPEHYKMRFIYGNKDSLLVDKTSMIISKSFAERYFGKENPVGKQIMVRDMPRFVISGVFEDLPQNLHLRADIYDLLPSSLMSVTEHQDYLLRGHIRLRIPNPKDVLLVESAINKLLASNPTLSDTPERKVVHLDPIRKIHYISNLKEDESTMNPLNTYAVMVIGVLILLAAILNFINIVILSWQQRTEEFAARRSVGALKYDIFKQLLTEYTYYFLTALILSAFLYLLVAKIFYKLVGFQSNPTFLQGVLALVSLLLILFVSGILSSANFSMGVMRNREDRYKKRVIGIKSILYAELTICFLFISLAAAISVGYYSVLNRDPGFDANNTLQYKYLTRVGSTNPMFYDSNILRDRIRSIPGVKYETATNFSVVTDKLDMDSRFDEGALELEGKNGAQRIVSYIVGTSSDFFTKRKMRLINGTLPMEQKSNAVIVNQTFVERFSPDESPLGRSIRDPGSTEGEFYQIAAVVNDAWFFPAHIQMIPMIYILNPMQLQFFQITYEQGKKYEVLSRVDDLFEEVSSRGILGFRSLDVSEEFNHYYKPDTTYVILTLFFAFIICAISLMGIYAVSSLQFYRQLKDIAIRKACGADFIHILRMLLKSYLLLFFVTGLGGILGSYYLAKMFFNRFALAVSYPWWVLPICVLVIFVVVFLPLYWNSRKVWKANPIKYLQSE